MAFPSGLRNGAHNRARRAIPAWIDRTNDGLSRMPDDGISLPPKKGGLSARPAGAARRLAYIKHATGWKGHDRLWHIASNESCAQDVRNVGMSGLTPNAKSTRMMLWTAPTLRHQGAIGW